MSGDGFEVLVRDRLATQIQLADGAQGYVRSAYIVTDKPARLIVAETQAEVDRLTVELADLRDAFQDPAAEISALNQRITTLTADVDTRSTRVAELEAELASMSRVAERYSNSVPLNWWPPSRNSAFPATRAGRSAGRTRRGIPGRAQIRRQPDSQAARRYSRALGRRCARPLPADRMR